MANSRAVLVRSPQHWAGLQVEVGDDPASADNVLLPAVPEITVVVIGWGRSRFQERDPGATWSAPLEIKPDDVFLTGSMRPAELHWRSSPGENVRSIAVAVRQDAFNRLAVETNIDPGRVEIIDRSAVTDPLLAQLSRTLAAACHHPDRADNLLVDGITQATVAHILNAHTSLRPEVPRPPSHTLAPSVLRRVTEYIDSHLEEPLHLHELANVAGCSTYHFAKAFRGSTGRTPHSFLTDKRLCRAADLIAGGNHNGLQTALAVGFSSQSRFIAQFKRRYGVTPARFARR